MIIDALMLIVFIPCALTGFVKFPFILNHLSWFEYVSYETISKIHDYSGIFFILLIIIHIFLHKKHLCGMVKTMKNRKMERK